ncbi:MAG TPA: hypothetical protein VNG04_09375 [Candidatus Acidoferrum sp.]|nr:hypothetical protein [Candidatus Acidoferrum sp.]HXJ32338.1 hypothetical protein [Gemmatimonadales bacterium]
MTYLLIPERRVPEDFDIASLFDGDRHSKCQLINDWGECARSFFVIARIDDQLLEDAS